LKRGVIPFSEKRVQEACQRGLVVAFVGDIGDEKRKKERGEINSSVLFLAK